MVTSGSTALVLAGGGAKGAFEAGAVTYLVEEAGVVPDIITATSAGALTAAVLAQARTPAELRLRVRQLHTDILAMTHNDVLFGKQPWVAALDGTVFGRALDDWVVGRTQPPVPGTTSDAPLAGPAVRRRDRSKMRTAGQVARALPHLARAARRIRGKSGSLLTLDPLADVLRHGGNGFVPVDPELVALPGLELRLAVVALGAGVLRYVSGDGTIVEADALTPVPGAGAGPVDLIEGVVASASVPMVFPPRPLAGDSYVDGGVLENVPVSAAARLGARRIYAVLAVPLALAPDRRDYSGASAADVLLRAVGAISFAERQRANLTVPLPEGTELTVIDPLVDVVGPFDVSPGLMRINLDYGWMRAADLLTDVADAARRRASAATDAVVAARSQAWHLEHRLWARGSATPSDLAALARCKRVIRDALLERKEAGLPTADGASRWWSGYEIHAGSGPAGLPESLLGTD